MIRWKRQSVYLAIAVLTSWLGFVSFAQATESAPVHFDRVLVRWGKTLLAADGAKAGIFPNGLVAPGEVTWTIHEGTMPSLPPNRKILGQVYRLSIDGATHINPDQPLSIAVAIPFGSSYWIRQVWVYDLDAKIWNPLRTSLNSDHTLGQAPSGIQRGLYAILEDRHQQEGIASWYCKTSCSSKYPTLHGTSNDFPIGTLVRVRSLETGRSVDVKIISTWGQPAGRIIDLSWAAYAALGVSNAGVTPVNVSLPTPIVLGATTAANTKIETIPKLRIVGNNGIPFPSFTPRPFVVYDQTSNTVLASYQKDQVMPLASLTKLMTAAVFLDTKTDLHKVVTYSTADQTPYGYLRVNPGETLEARDLFYAMLVGSANNAATALARSTGLTRAQFIQRMNDKAKAWGLGQTKFVDVNGLDPRNVSTAEEVARMSAQIFHEYEPVRYVTVKREYIFYTINTRVYHRMVTTDKLLGSSAIDSGQIITGGKTGYLDESLYNYVVRVANKNQGTQVVTVILHSATSASRFADAAAASNWAGRNFRWAP